MKSLTLSHMAKVCIPHRTQVYVHLHDTVLISALEIALISFTCSLPGVSVIFSCYILSLPGYIRVHLKSLIWYFLDSPSFWSTILRADSKLSLLLREARSNLWGVMSEDTEEPSKKSFYCPTLSDIGYWLNAAAHRTDLVSHNTTRSVALPSSPFG